MNWKEKIEKDIKENNIMVYMRGEKDAPRCGFSFRVVNIFKNLEVPFKTEDMDQDRALWDTLKEMNDWPTSPQIFIKGEFMGGADIIMDMYKSGELQKLLGLQE